MTNIEGSHFNFGVSFDKTKEMPPAALPTNELERLNAVYETELLDTEAEESFDEVARLAAAVCGVPISLVSLIDERRQWYKAKIGMNVNELPRAETICSHTILQNELFVVPDTLADQRFTDNPHVQSVPGVRFYAGMPLATASGLNIGTLCVADFSPRLLTDEQQQALRTLAKQTMAQIELRKRARDLEAEIVAKLRLQNELILANDRLQEMAVTDPLTRLKNRRAFRESLEREIEESRRYTRPLSLLMLDVDNFKKVNDTYGHLTGDEVLRGIALVLAATVRASDLAARYGGEEFAVLMPSTGTEEAVSLGQRICANVAASEIAHLHPTVSIGVATFMPPMFDSGELVSSADEALYRAKHAGKNCVICA